ncbi:MAG: hypothetical protein P1U58_14330 [Verrucomicrobiales bacterium]|nr:hypothetical protein [Verrucomicrobiales bacterium]
MADLDQRFERDQAYPKRKLNADKLNRIREVFRQFKLSAIDYFDATGRHLPVFGELGEIYAERRFGIKRHGPGRCGSDGRIGNTLVEIKTISPLKGNDEVRVKRSGNFGALILVKFDADHRVDAKIVLRKNLPKGMGKWMRVRRAEVRCEQDHFRSLL